ncbi:MAG: hypothetical protein Q7U47_01755, partial [Paludibacter sp.]|nr:hypothetical protein [Paludibacter sp.]
EENLCAMVELSGGLSKGNLRYTWSSGGEISMAFGTKKILGETIFAGVGVAYQVVSVSSTSEMMGFIPVFVRLQSIIMKKEKTAPYLSLDAGYAFTTDPNYGGGTYAKFSTGFMHKISFKMSVYAGLYARAQGFSGALSETVNAVNVTYQGNSSIYDVGAKVGIQF